VERRRNQHLALFDANFCHYLNIKISAMGIILSDECAWTEHGKDGGESILGSIPSRNLFVQPDRDPCSARQIRNGLFLINMLVWTLFIITVGILA